MFFKSNYAITFSLFLSLPHLSQELFNFYGIQKDCQMLFRNLYCFFCAKNLTYDAINVLK